MSSLYYCCCLVDLLWVGSLKCTRPVICFSSYMEPVGFRLDLPVCWLTNGSAGSSSSIVNSFFLRHLKQGRPSLRQIWRRHNVTKIRTARPIPIYNSKSLTFIFYFVDSGSTGSAAPVFPLSVLLSPPFEESVLSPVLVSTIGFCNRL